MPAARCRVFLPIKPPKHRQAYHYKLLYHTLVHENMSARTDTRLMHIIDTPAPVAARHKALHAQNAMRCDARNRGLLHAELFCKSCQTDVLQFSVEIVSAPELFTSSHAPRGRFFPLSLLSRLEGAVLANFLNIFFEIVEKIFSMQGIFIKTHAKKARNAEFYLTLLAVFFLSNLICFFHIHVPMVFTD